MPSNINSGRVAALAEILIAARTHQEPVGVLPDQLVPTSAAEAEAVDDKVAGSSGWQLRGWKIGCTSEHAQKLLGSPGPFAGRVYSRYDGPTTLGSRELVTTPHLEGEFAFTIGADLAPSEDGHDRAAVVAAVADVRPAIEIVGGRFLDFFGTPLFSLMADAGANTHLIVGEPAADFDPEALPSTGARMEVDGEITGSGSGADVLGDPIEALLWLANHLSERSITLRAGDIVTTGTATQVSTLAPGSTATVSLDGIGSVSLSRG